MNKRMFVYLGLIVAVVVGIGVLSGVIPPKSGTEGTIGAANRYQSPQIADKDVALGNSEFNDLLQSDIVHKLATNAEFRKMWEDAGKRIANDPIARKAFQDEDFAKLLGNGLAAEVARNVTVVERGTKVEEIARGAKIEDAAKRAGVEDAAKRAGVEDAAKRANVEDAAKRAGVEDAAKGAQQSGLEKRYVIVDVARVKADLDKQFGNSESYQRVRKLQAFEDVLRSPLFAEMAAKHSAELAKLSGTPEGQALWKNIGMFEKKANLDMFDRALNSSGDAEKRVR